MTDEDKKLIEAAWLIKNKCMSTNSYMKCPFSETGICELKHCSFFKRKSNVPGDWKIKEFRRWTDADVALAKALMAFGVEKIHRQPDTHAITFNCDKINYEYHCLPEASFLDMKPDEYVYLKDIVAEGENYG